MPVSAKAYVTGTGEGERSTIGFCGGASARRGLQSITVVLNITTSY
jgi:hypothetical protein